ncbi:hypothetical protein HBH64_060370 [Parastagonospora nodorum]|nr:hypothetical protein HBH90_012020 [Parastagonospora nodorum]KAH4596665.1 hypothetical protein HBH83_010820 [Parastagonospora nodorum]KAH4732372.1 hypothetical protein HBH66_034420 [Parastagonospora nodorum]KAH4752392.1 hypothetical protein HBH64_060370 [Parastagonospora nodorum]KAH4795748.1 hypothetical protein HBH65_035410 [Parastagonospora nodorum]
MILFTTAFLAWVASASGQSISTGTSASRSGSILPRNTAATNAFNSSKSTYPLPNLSAAVVVYGNIPRPLQVPSAWNASNKVVARVCTSIVNITAWWCARLGLSNDNNCKISEEVVFGIRREDYWSLQAESGGIISAKTPNSSVFVPDANRLFPFKTNGTGPLTAGIGRFVMGITVDYFSFNGTPNFAQLLKDT